VTHPAKELDSRSKASGVFPTTPNAQRPSD